MKIKKFNEASFSYSNKNKKPEKEILNEIKNIFTGIDDELDCEIDFTRCIVGGKIMPYITIHPNYKNEILSGYRNRPENDMDHLENILHDINLLKSILETLKSHLTQLELETEYKWEFISNIEHYGDIELRVDTGTGLKELGPSVNGWEDPWFLRT